MVNLQPGKFEQSSQSGIINFQDNFPLAQDLCPVGHLVLLGPLSG